MNEDDSDPSQEVLETCTFCFIASGADKEATIVKKNKDLVCFKDIYPAAPHHYLVVPTLHINSCHSLQRRHVHLGQIFGLLREVVSPTVERMAEMGRAVLRDQGITNLNDIRLNKGRGQSVTLFAVNPSFYISQEARELKRLGFHQPPYTSVDHLHLHVLAPASQISEYLAFKFLPKSDRFVTEKSFLKHLKRKPPGDSCVDCDCLDNRKHVVQ